MMATAFGESHCLEGNLLKDCIQNTGVICYKDDLQNTGVICYKDGIRILQKERHPWTVELQ